MPNMNYNSGGRHGHPRSPIPVHPPFPSFAWVMTAQANPPTDAYAHGYVQNAHTHTRALTQRQTRLPAHCTAHHGSYQSNPCTTKPLLPPPSLAPAPAEVTPMGTHEMFMQTVDYRYDDDQPTRPFVPWRADLGSYEMQRIRSSVALPAVSPSRAKRRRLDSLLRALRRACRLSKDTTRPRRAA